MVTLQERYGSLHVLRRRLLPVDVSFLGTGKTAMTGPSFLFDGLNRFKVILRGHGKPASMISTLSQPAAARP
jgi:hypothetical protein